MSGRVWCIADPHIYHEKVSLIRGYSVIDFVELFCEDWVQKVKAKDQVWILGDLTGGGYIRETFDLLSGLPGEKHLIIGNHDGCFPGHRDSHRRVRRYFDVYESVQLHARRSINGTNVLVSHFPYSGDHTDTERHAEFRLPDRGIPLVHGHTHSSDLVSYSSSGTLQLNVGWEATGGLVLFDSLSKYLDD